MAMDEIRVETFLDEVITTGVGTSFQIPTEIKSFQLNCVTSAGAGTVGADIEGSNDGVVWHWVANSSEAAVSTTAKSIASTTTNCYKYHRCNLYTITGTDCTVTCTVSYID